MTASASSPMPCNRRSPASIQKGLILLDQSDERLSSPSSASLALGTFSPPPQGEGNQAAARIAAFLTLSSTAGSNCLKFDSKRCATSRAALS